MVTQVRIAFFAMLLAASNAAADSKKDRNDTVTETAIDTAKKLFEAGRDLASHAQFKEACDRFARSYELDPAAGTALNFADCQEHLGNLARAWQLFDAAAATADRDKNPVRAQYARDRANVLVPRLGVIVVKIADNRLDALAVKIGDRRVPAGAEVHERVDPGDIEVSVDAPERHFEATAHVTAGAISSIDVPVLGAAATQEESHRDRNYAIGAIALGGAGVVAIIASGLLGLDANQYYNDAYSHGQCFHTGQGDGCNADGIATVATAHSRANLGTGLFVAGVALIAGGAGLYYFAPKQHLEVAPIATPTTAGVSLSGRF